jgi:hypothetical protein
MIVMGKLLLKLWKSNRQFALYLLHLNEQAKKFGKQVGRRPSTINH